MLGLLKRRDPCLNASTVLAESAPTLVLSRSQGQLLGTHGRRLDESSGLSWSASCPLFETDQDEPFRRVGRYLLVEKLGAGSQAVVWRALHYEPPISEVALKLVPVGGRADRRHIARLRHEADRGRRISSPAMLPTLDHGSADGFVYLALPLVSGCSLREVILQRRRDAVDPPQAVHPLAATSWPVYWDTILRGLARICRTVQDAHDAEVAHRDIKPANILVDWNDPERIYLADFGMGRDLDIATPAQLSADGSGTPLYMSPEKLRGQPGDERSADIYALGVTLFESATLQRPYAIPAGLSGVVLMAYLSQQRPLRPTEANRRVPIGLERIILKAMASRPEDRYPTARALANDIERFLATGDHFRRTWLSSTKIVVARSTI